MQPLTTLDLLLNIFVAVVMPLIIAANLSGRGRGDSRNARMWREHSDFMWVSLVIIGLVSLWSFVQLAGHFGLVSSSTVEAALFVIAIPFLIAAAVEIWLGIRLAVQYLRARRPTA